MVLREDVVTEIGGLMKAAGFANQAEKAALILQNIGSAKLVTGEGGATRQLQEFLDLYWENYLKREIVV